MTRTERQELAEQRWEQKGCRATIVAFTGFGKTNIAKIAVNRLRRNDKTRSVVVCVPGEALKEQWTRVLGELIQNTRVIIINSLAALEEPIECDLFIVDEDHRAAADVHNKIFQNVRFKWGLGLTPRIKRLDKKEGSVTQHLPVCDVISMQEGRRYGWTAPFREYNLGLEMTSTESAEYDKMEKEYNRMLDKFKQDFGLMQDCSRSIRPYSVMREGVTMYLAPQSVKLAREYGWVGNTARMAYMEMERNRDRPRGQKVNIWGGDRNHPFHPDKIYVWALHGMTQIRKIKAFVYNYPPKILAAEEIIRRLNRRTIVFAELVKTANELYKRLGSERAAIYHTKVTKKEGSSLKSTKREALADVLEGRKMWLLSAKSVDEGLDWPSAQLGVDVSRTSNPLQHIQRTGRITRKHTFDDGTDKESIFVNIYVLRTRDLKWLYNSQEKGKGQIISWVSSVQEIIETELEFAEGVAN